ncbi:hypothetical protein GF402_10800 [Candidatus Fermentibacteria bacterium]|nr:hypothetical protein [Candidatus Fermentibacteria bacterium]
MTRALALLCLIPVGCAKVVPPKGGPEDRDPPRLVEVMPPSGGGYGELREVRVVWSERLEPASVSCAVYPPSDVEVKVDGETVEVRLPQPPDSGTTVLHFPRGLSDRRGNNLAEALDLAYTASDSLAGGRMVLSLSRQAGGRVGDRTLVDLYDSEDLERGDTLLIRRTEADTSGVARLRWLPGGSYLLRCYEDRDRSYSWQSDVEAGTEISVALPSGDSLYLEPTLVVVDTVGPSLIDAEALDAHHVSVTMSEEVSFESMREAEIELFDSTGTRVAVHGLWALPSRQTYGIELVTGRMSSGDMLLRMRGFSDLVGNVGASDSLSFEAVDSLPSDTLRITSVYPEPGGREIPPDGPFYLNCSDWVHRDSLRRKLSLIHVAADSMVAMSVTPLNSKSFRMVPQRTLVGHQQYKIRLREGLLSAWGDTLESYSWSFVPAWSDQPGWIEGILDGTSREVILQLSPSGAEGEEEQEIVYHPVQPGRYRVQVENPGGYTVAGFVDLDEDGSWDAGSEPYGSYPGMVNVYPGTETTGVDITVIP